MGCNCKPPENLLAVAHDARVALEIVSLSSFLSYQTDTVYGMEVKVIRSARRRKTIQARMEGDILKVMVPDGLTAEQEAHWVEVMQTKLATRKASEPGLAERADRLADTFNLPRPTSVEWSTRQNHRWGSCTPATGRIRLSSRMIKFPGWVIDYVLIHELAHLAESGHGPAFEAVLARYPKSERAEGYLIAKAEETG